MPGDKLLDLVEVSKEYSGTKVLDAVSFSLHAGEVHCLVGENGAGKSTLIKILSGAVQPNGGQIRLAGRVYSHLEPKDSLRLGIATIYQDIDLIETLSVADNIYLGDELRTPLGFVDRQKQISTATQLLERLRIRVGAAVLVGELSPAQKQMIQLAKALHRESRIIIMDEPTSSLGHEEARALMELVRGVIAGGVVGIIYISHFLDEVFQIGDRITVLKDGRMVATHTKGEVDPSQVIREMVGREASLFYNREKVRIGEPVLQVSHFSRAGAVKDVSFEVREGEIFGIGGLVGSGRTELANLLFGADPADGGRLYLHGQDITAGSPHRAIANGISMIAENRQEDGLFLIRPVKENMVVLHTEKAGPLVGRKRENALVRGMVKRFGIVASPSQEARELSGGNQQKVIMSRWLLSEARVYIFDEPTKGIDIGAKQEIYRFMTELAGSGKLIIMISSDMPELLSMSDRIGVMRNGEMVKVIDAQGVSEAGLLEMFLGIAAA